MNEIVQKQAPRELSNLEKIMQKTKYNSTSLQWNNFHQVHPEADRMLLVWCDLGNIAPNLYLTYRDRMGGYDMPHPQKNYPVKAWAYVDLPNVDEEDLLKIEKELRNQKKEAKKLKS